MATYKKRGYKPKTKEEKTEAIEQHSTTAEVFNTLDESASRTEEWAVKNQKYIIGVVAGIAVVVLGYLGYSKFVAEPKASEAMNEMYTAQSYFDQALTATSKDSLFALALKGGQGKYGMIDIADKYSATPAGNLANYYAGIAFLNIKDYQNAIKHLNKFSSKDDMLAPIAKGAIGDAFVQLNQPKEALDYYEKAVSLSTNEFTTPMYLMKAGHVALNLGENKKALANFNRIKDEFPNGSEATNIDAFIGKAEASL